MLSDTPHSVLSPHARSSNRGFTLIELLMVIAIIMILAGITFGISRGVQNAQARAAAKAELTVLSQAIEQFKLRYGDYPWHDSDDGDYPNSAEVTNTMLLYALTGRLSMERVTQNDNTTLVVSLVNEDLDHADVRNRPKFIDITKFSMEEDSSGEAVAFLDPWGNPYIYRYKWENKENDAKDDEQVWDVFGYHLYSTGAKGDTANAAIGGKIDDNSGVLDNDFRDVANLEGIIFSGE
jgi:prepilin-type N-terminal cleavage/methylation domain-containing protein